jgi:hypothetical protein
VVTTILFSVPFVAWEDEGSKREAAGAMPFDGFDRLTASTFEKLRAGRFRTGGMRD